MGDIREEIINEDVDVKVINLNVILETFKDSKMFKALNDITDIFMRTLNPVTFLELLSSKVGDEIASAFFQYLLADENLNSIPEKHLRETLAAINSYKSLYGKIIKKYYYKMGNPFEVEGIIFSRKNEANVVNMVIHRNDDTKFSALFVFNTMLNLARQNVEMLNQLYNAGGNNIDLELFRNYASALTSFLQVITDSKINLDDDKNTK